MRFTAASILLGLLMSALCATATPTAEVATVNGMVQGQMSDRYPGVSNFKGIPYATPPLGTLRFAPAQAVNINWTGTLNTTEFSAGCMNVCGLPRPSFTCTPTISEDCLYLNVFTPAPLPASSGSLLPVLLFIHGGAFIAGAGGTPIYEASKLAHTQNMVVVTFNYRLGVFGAFYLNGEDGAVGNQMMSDQTLAMKWVQANIANFGGDPTRVTLGGESAGAISVGCHLVSPQSQGLFQAAYMSSNPYGLPMMDISLVTKLGEKIVTNVGCDASASAQDQLLCVQSVTAESLLVASNTTRNTPWPDQILASLLPWMPVVIPGSDVLPVYPFQEAGTLAQVPVLIGTNANDSIPFVYDFSAKPLSQPIMDGIVAYVFGFLNAITIREKYGDCHCTDARYWFSDIATDYMFYCASRNVTARLAQSSTNPVYAYVFGHKPSFATWMWDAVDPLCDTKVCHADDVPFVFDNLEVPGHVVPQPTSNERRLIQWMQNAVGAFVNGNGVMPASIGWTPYDPSTDSVMWLDVNSQHSTPWMISGHHADFCAMWDSIGYTSR